MEKAQKQRPILVGITGGTASGKTTVCEKVYERLGGRKECTLLPLDCFYKELNDEEMKEVGKYNFDHPDAFDWPLLRAILAQLLNYQDVEIPNYNYTTCRRDAGPPIPLKCTHLILFEGIFALWDEELRREMDLKIFVHSDDDVRLLRRLKRDVVHRGRTIEGVIKSYNRFVKAAYDEYIKPTMKYADIIVPKGGENQIGIDFITENLKNQLRERSGRHHIIKQASSQLFEEIPFETIEKQLLTQYSQKGLNMHFPTIENDISELITLKMINNQDKELYSLYQNHLAKQLIKQFQEVNTGIQKDEMEFINQLPEQWQNYDLTNALTSLKDPQQCKHVCLFFPELVSEQAIIFENFKKFCDTLYMFRAMHQIEKIHILTYFLSPTFLDNLQNCGIKNLSDIHIYSLTLSQNLKQHPCFITSVHRQRGLSGADDDIDLTSQSSQMKIEAFQHRDGTLDSNQAYKVFYSQGMFEC